MTITEQDRMLAERNATNRAKEKAREVGNWLDVKLTEPRGLNALALRFDDFAASLLAEAREAQHKASWAMAMSAADKYIQHGDWCGRDELSTDLRAFPTPPITNEGE